MFSTIFFPFGLSSFHISSYLTRTFRQCNPSNIRKSGLVCTFEFEIRDFPQPYFNFSMSKNRTMGAKCNRLIAHLAADQQALMLVCFQTSLAILPIFITTFFSNFTDFFLHFQNSLTLEFFSDFPDPQTGKRPLYTWGPPRHLIWQVKTIETELINFFCRQQFSIDSFWSMPFLDKNKIFHQVKNLVCCWPYRLSSRLGLGLDIV